MKTKCFMAGFALLLICVWICGCSKSDGTRPVSPEMHAQLELAAQYWYKAQDSNSSTIENSANATTNYQQAVAIWTKVAEQGSDDAQYWLGNCFEHGNGIGQDLAKAVYWYRKSAEQGNAKAQLDLGECYAAGIGLVKNYTEAAMWYRKAAEQKDNLAMINLGRLYEKGDGVEQDFFEAEKWYYKAKNGDETDKILGESLHAKYAGEEGRIKPGRMGMAVQWYLKNAEKGDLNAQWTLGFLSHAGIGVVKNADEMFKWWGMAAEKGDSLAQFALGDAYFNGFGGETNYVEAYKWLNIAVENGSGTAAKMRDQAMLYLTLDSSCQCDRIGG